MAGAPLRVLCTTNAARDDRLEESHAILLPLSGSNVLSRSCHFGMAKEGGKTRPKATGNDAKIDPEMVEVVTNCGFGGARCGRSPIGPPKSGRCVRVLSFLGTTWPMLGATWGPAGSQRVRQSLFFSIKFTKESEK